MVHRVSTHIQSAGWSPTRSFGTWQPHLSRRPQQPTNCETNCDMPNAKSHISNCGSLAPAIPWQVRGNTEARLTSSYFRSPFTDHKFQLMDMLVESTMNHVQAILVGIPWFWNTPRIWCRRDRAFGNLNYLTNYLVGPTIPKWRLLQRTACPQMT